MKFTEKVKRFFTLSAKHEGFTLVELIVVIAILAILAGVAVPAYSGYIKKAEKAGDLTLLAAVNDAFAAGCLQEGIVASQLSSATLTWNGQCVVGVATVNGSANADIDAAFKIYYAGNETNEFKVLNSQNVVFVGGVFKEAISGAVGALFNSIIGNEAYADAINAMKGSALPGIGGEALVDQVDQVTGIAAALIAATKTNANGDVEESALSKVVMSDEYCATMAQKLGYEDGDAYFAALMEMYNEDPTTAANFMANSTLLNVAGTVGGWTADEETAMKNALIGLDYTALVKKVTTDATAEEGLAQAALLYGMYTTFDPEGAKTLISDTDPLASMKDLGGNTNASGQTFADYLAGLNDPTSQAYKDFEGYKGALDVVNGAASESPDAAKELLTNGYDNSELAAMLNQVMGN